jgi:hypothetical protein
MEQEAGTFKAQIPRIWSIRSGSPAELYLPEF